MILVSIIPLGGCQESNTVEKQQSETASRLQEKATPTTLAEIVDSNTDDPQRYIELADSQAQNGDLNQAIQTLETGIRIFQTEGERVEASGEKTLPGEVVFKLYDTFGFPVDIVRDVVRDEGLTLDTDGFEQRMDRQRENRDDEKPDVNHDLVPCREAGGQHMGVGIAAEKHPLEKKHAGGPHSLGAAEPGQDELAHHWLQLKEQKRAQKQGEPIVIHGTAFCCGSSLCGPQYRMLWYGQKRELGIMCTYSLLDPKVTLPREVDHFFV